MIPIFVRDKQTRKWEIFPADKLEQLHDGYLGFDSKYWSSISEKDEDLKASDILSKYRKHFVRDDNNAKHGPCRYIFLPGLPWRTRWGLRIEEKYRIALRSIPDILMVSLLISSFLAMATIFGAGVVAIIKWLIG